MSVAILRMPHGLDYSLILTKKGVAGNGLQSMGHVNGAFNGSNDALNEAIWNMNSDQG